MRRILTPCFLMFATVIFVVGVIAVDHWGVFLPRYSDRMFRLAACVVGGTFAFELLALLLRVGRKLSIGWMLLLITAAALVGGMYSIHRYNDQMRELAFAKLRSVVRELTADKDRQSFGEPFAFDQQAGEMPLTVVSFAVEEDIGCGCCYDHVTTGLDDRDVEGLQWFSSLTSVDYSRSQVTAAAVKALRRSTGLRRLSLEECPKVDDDVVEWLSGFSKLEQLDLAGTQVTSQGLYRIRHLDRLTNLSLRGTRVDDSALDTLKRFTKLETLDLRDTSISGAGIGQLSRCQSLKSLHIPPMSASAFGELNRLTSLPYLHVAVTESPDENTLRLEGPRALDSLTISCARGNDICIHNIPSLRHLGIQALYCPHASADDSTATSLKCAECRAKQVALSLAGLPTLESLTIGGVSTLDHPKITSVTQVSLTGGSRALLNQIACFPNLEKLTINCTSDVLDLEQHLDVLSQMDQLIELTVYRQSLSSLPNLTNLRVLRMPQTLLSMQGIRQVAEFPNLQELFIKRVVGGEAAMTVLKELNLKSLSVRFSR